MFSSERVDTRFLRMWSECRARERRGPSRWSLVEPPNSTRVPDERQHGSGPMRCGYYPQPSLGCQTSNLTSVRLARGLVARSVRARGLGTGHGTPAQVRLPGGRGLVEALDGGRVGGRLDQFG